MNAKKIDIDFDNDDFFNQFDPIALAKQQEKEAEEREAKRKAKEEKERLEQKKRDEEKR